MEQPTDGATSDSEAPDEEGRQITIHFHVAELMLRIVDRPFGSIPQPIQ